MYGLVNKAIEDMVTQLRGLAAWEALKRAAGLNIETFIGMDPYDDDVTYRLVAAASEMFGQSPEEVLEAFGEYWTLYTSEKGYGQLMAAAGNSVFEFLENLNDMHARVGMIFPAMQLPHFSLERGDATTATLYYDSDRPGLAPMVVGLVKGLGKRFGTPVTVERLERREAGAAEDTFRVTLCAAA